MHWVKSELRLSRGLGESASTPPRRAQLAGWLIKDALAQEIEVGAAVHLALEEFETRDLPFGLALAPGRGEGRLNRRQIPAHPLGKGGKFWDLARVCRFQPGRQVSGLVLS